MSGSDGNKSYWNNIYKEAKDNKIVYDLWLDKYKELLERNKDTTILDLGCGSGADSLYLKERGYNVLACDYCNESLEIIKNNIQNIETMNLDITKKFPFKDESFNLIIADLSIHYFSEGVTFSIINEIKRILKQDGYLFCRVNSLCDVNYGAGQGREIEKHFYETKHGNKRFFTEDDINYFFDMWNIKRCEETTIIRYGNEKRCFEICCKNMVE